MLQQLSIRNLGLIESVDLEFGPGLQVITGETGVGKTLLLGSLSILRGDRVRNEWIRAGCDHASISGFFRLDPARQSTVEELLGLPLEDGELLVERSLRRTGRGRSRVNGREVPVALLRQVGGQLLEIHGQRAQLSLLEPRRQLETLDRFAGLDGARERFGHGYREARRLESRLLERTRSQRDRNERRLFLDQTLAELEAAGLERGERAELERELELLEERDRIQTLVSGVLDQFSESEGSILDIIGSRARETRDLSELHPGLAEFAEGCRSAQVSLEECVRALQGVAEDLHRDPEELRRTQERFDFLLRLEERYRRSGDELVDYHQELATERDRLSDEGDEIPRLQEELEARVEALEKEAATLTRRRRAAARKLSSGAASELRDLGMERARFEVAVERLAAGGAEEWRGFDDAGQDSVEIIFGPNPGEPARPLRDIASGGELSRVMLSLERLLAGIGAVGTLVFDEIDTGVGGRLGAALGLKLRQIGDSHQVMCVTHLPQVASCGHSHFRVDKRVEGDRTVTSIQRLDEKERIEEVAAMIRGEERTPTSLAEARDMIAQACTREATP